MVNLPEECAISLFQTNRDATRESSGVDLVTDYVRVSRPCLVKFKAQGNAADAATALLYLCHSIHRREIDAFNLGATYDAKGRCIPASAIVAVEIDPRWEATR